jgi:type IV pilus assembly protein PilM
MAVQGRPILGVDINDVEIRIVEVRGTFGAPQVVHAGAVATPRAAMEGDRIVRVSEVAEAVRGLLSRMGVTTRAAVLGVGGPSTVTRVLDIPRVPDHEVRMVIEGELAHYQIMREGSGTFDYMRLREAEASAGSGPQVLLMAADEKVIGALRAVADQAGLQVASMEPVLLGTFRAAYDLLQGEASGACLSVTYGRSEIAIVDHGDIRLYRRADIGSNDLIGGRTTRAPQRPGEEVPQGRMLLGGDQEPAPVPEDSTATGCLRSDVASSLATELQRSLDYYRREFPQSSAATRVLLATNDAELEPLAEWLSSALNLDVSLADPPASPGVSRSIAAQLEPPGGLRFLAACGLAMHGLPGHPDAMPRFDLSVREREHQDAIEARGRLWFSLGVSAVILAAGAFMVFHLSGTAQEMDRELKARRQVLAGKQRLATARVQDLVELKDQLDALKKEGFPVPRIMDALASTVDPRAGLREVKLERDGRVAVAGEAANEEAMIRTRDSLGNCAMFDGTSLDSFNTRTENEGRVVDFQISAQLAGTLPPLGVQPPAR